MDKKKFAMIDDEALGTVSGGVSENLSVNNASTNAAANLSANNATTNAQLMADAVTKLAAVDSDCSNG